MSKLSTQYRDDLKQTGLEHCDRRGNKLNLFYENVTAAGINNYIKKQNGPILSPEVIKMEQND